jgi:uncharacterized protein (TIGR02996 family)
MSASREALAFLEAVRASPHDDAPRLMYADWLMERGDPRGEFIQLQCVLAQMPRNDEHREATERRCAEVLRLHQDQWLRPLRELGVGAFRFSRGFVEAVTVPAARFLALAPALFAVEPIQAVCLPSPQSRDFTALASSAHLARVRGLAVMGCDVQAADVRALVGSRHAAGLTGLELADGTHMGLEAVRELTESAGLPNLRYLRLHESSRTTRDLVGCLAEARGLRNLTNLHLPRIGLTSKTLLELLTSPALPNLSTLGLWNNHLGDAELLRLLDTPALARLRALNLNTNNLTRRSAEALAAWPSLRGLKILHVAFNDLGREGVWALIDSPNRDPNCDLNVCHCGNPPEAERRRIRERLGASSLDLGRDWAGDRLQP